MRVELREREFDAIYEFPVHSPHLIQFFFSAFRISTSTAVLLRAKEGGRKISCFQAVASVITFK